MVLDLRAWLPSPEPPALGMLEALQYDVILIDPPLESYVWESPTELQPTWTWDEIASLPVPRLASRDSFVFLWVGSGANDGLERGRDLLARWGYRRCEDIVWVQTSDDTGAPRPASSLLVPSVQHCLMGIRGTVVRSTDSFFVHCNVDTDVIMWPGERPAPGLPVSPIYKPPELYSLIENFCLGTRRIELFGTNRNLREGWLTLGCDLGPEAPGWPATGACPFDPPLYMSCFALDPPGCPLHCRSNVLPFSEECEKLRPRTPPKQRRLQGPPAAARNPPVSPAVPMMAPGLLAVPHDPTGLSNPYHAPMPMAAAPPPIPSMMPPLAAPALTPDLVPSSAPFWTPPTHGYGYGVPAPVPAWPPLWTPPQHGEPGTPPLAPPVPPWVHPRRPTQLQPPRSQLLGQGAGGRAKVSVPSGSERFSGPQAEVLKRSDRR